MAADAVKIRPNLDDIDRAIIATLQSDARISNAALAERTGIAASTCIARVRSLVARGVITGFRTDIEPAVVGLGLQALISVAIKPGARRTLATFASEIGALPEVVQVFFLGGAEDFIIHVATRDSDDVRRFVVDHLSAHPAVASTRTSLVFEHRSPGLTVPGTTAASGPREHGSSDKQRVGEHRE